MRLSFFILSLMVAFVAVSARKWKCDPVSAPQCQEHATYNACGPNRFCYPTCGWVIELKFEILRDLSFFLNFSGPDGPPCLMGCNPGCFCDEGYILNVADGLCIRPEDCRPLWGWIETWFKFYPWNNFFWIFKKNKNYSNLQCNWLNFLTDVLIGKKREVHVQISDSDAYKSAVSKTWPNLNFFIGEINSPWQGP